MNDLIKIDYGDADRPTVSGRELHETSAETNIHTLGGVIMARRKEKPLIVYSCVLMPDGTKVRTTDLPPEVWAEKRKELAKRFAEAYARALENNPHDMKLIYENPERYGATIYPL